MVGVVLYGLNSVHGLVHSWSEATWAGRRYCVKVNCLLSWKTGKLLDPLMIQSNIQMWMEKSDAK